MSVGVPQSIYLREFGDYVYAAFGCVAYHVGSSLANKDGWRDVDVRVLLPDEEWARLDLGDPENPHTNRRWTALTLAWSAFGRAFTGLPIDFQLQQRSHANEKYPHNRSALVRIDRMEQAAASAAGKER